MFVAATTTECFDCTTTSKFIWSVLILITFSKDSHFFSFGTDFKYFSLYFPVLICLHTHTVCTKKYIRDDAVMVYIVMSYICFNIWFILHKYPNKKETSPSSFKNWGTRYFIVLQFMHSKMLELPFYIKGGLSFNEIYKNHETFAYVYF